MTVADLDLEVEEEAPSKGIDTPAYWPSRDGSVVVEDLTCHYAPQVSIFMNKLASLTLISARPCPPRSLLHYRAEGENRYLREDGEW